MHLVIFCANNFRIMPTFNHLQDPRRGEFYWGCKENDEQKYRYMELRKNKDKFLSELEKFKHYKRQESLVSIVLEYST